ncbi:putative reverse transcriptase domain-containing protein [Tanacetum coccineum]
MGAVMDIDENGFYYASRRRLKKVSVKRLVERRVAKAIEEYEKSRANLDGVGSSGGNNGNARRTVNVQGCRALTWWNGNVHTLGLVNANRIPWTEFKMMMTTEYCPAIEIQKMEQELWTLTLKGDDIEAYNNDIHELALMCPELVPTERKKIEKYVHGFPERIKGNITSSKPATLHDAISMARELVKQSVQGRATTIGENNKRKWEDHQEPQQHNKQPPTETNNLSSTTKQKQGTAWAYAR